MVTTDPGTSRAFAIFGVELRIILLKFIEGTRIKSTYPRALFFY
jgi:hypothetical protein